MEWNQEITGPIIERQMRLRNALRRAESPKSAAHRFLTISREEGTMADEIAQALARRLGWRLYDRELVNQIANNSHLREELVRQLDERSYLAHDSIVDMVVHLLKLPDSTAFDAQRYHEALLKTLVTVAAHGDAVIVGRGANFVLRWVSYGFHVRLIGSLETRIQRLSATWKVAPEIARERLLKVDAERRAFIQQHFQEDLDDPRFYAVVLNTDQLSMQQIVDTILSLLNPESAGSQTGLAAGVGL